MRAFESPKDWKTFPIRISSGKTSRCCNAPAFLVQVAKGGLVKPKCSECGQERDTLEEEQFKKLDLWIVCPQCNSPMTAEKIQYGNYGYVCTKCDVSIKLADLVPPGEDLKNKVI
jgi:DNA-directed RNA polymerase subunit RPC12/RpoP